MTRLVCGKCLTDSFLQGQFDYQEIDECSYCGEEKGVVELNEIVSMCEEALHAAFQYVQQPVAVVLYNRDPIGMPLQDVLSLMLGCSEDLVNDLASALLEEWSDWDDDDPSFIEQTYATSEMTSEWAKMERSLHDEARFVNPEAVRILERVFGPIEELHTTDNSSPILTIGPGLPIHSFQRARVFSNDGDVEQAFKHPERSLGPPPGGIGKAGRMNAKGVSVFYGATNDLTAIAEVRSPVGSVVVTAAFNVIRPLRLLNLAALSEIRPDRAFSYFDPVRVEQAQRCTFLMELQKKLLMPVMPELEDRGYLITQVIADFLSTHTSLRLDGIYFPSIQVSNHEGVTPGYNVILFSKACGVLKHESKYEADQVSLWEHDEDGRYFRPEIWGGKGQEHPHRRRGDWFTHQGMPPSYEPTLELDRNRISIHRVKGVVYDVEHSDVSYYAFEDK
ncbi:RES family NAD+ phosphorylase [Pseudomonas sp. dw_612]|uniref:RES family NAD+ phosphorylase n=1 Tax=Pseudomonas sp. dw_612 TaxID=2720080 RepID=UPI001BD569F0|nr:RES family NAD+ phosphorylase [Pseudomonas sp. dw_612]